MPGPAFARGGRWRHTVALLGILIAVAGCGRGDTTAGLAKGANVLVITLDTVRTDRIGGYGYNQAMTPNIDAFLEESVGFEEALTVRALTEPSLASMLTGLYPYQHQVAGNGYQIVDPLPANLVDAFKRAGYEVNAIAANGCTLMRQFDWNDFRCTKTHDPRAVDAAIQVLDRSREQPQFLWLHLFATHSPYGGLGHARTLFPDYDGPADGNSGGLRRLSQSGQASERDLAFLNARYDGGMRYTDHHVGRVLDQVAKSWPEAVVVLASDHGEELGDHDLYLFHACSSYRAGLRIPLAIRAPGLEPRRIRRLVENRDLAATLLALTGVEAEVPGVSLLSSDGGTDAAFSGFDTYPIWTVQNSGWRLVVNPDEVEVHCYPEAEPGVVAIEQTELYRLRDDPNEQMNVAAHYPDQVASLRARLEAWPGYGRQSQRQDLDQETRKELEALGYVD